MSEIRKTCSNCEFTKVPTSSIPCCNCFFYEHWKASKIISDEQFHNEIDELKDEIQRLGELLQNAEIGLASVSSQLEKAQEEIDGLKKERDKMSKEKIITELKKAIEKLDGPPEKKIECCKKCTVAVCPILVSLERIQDLVEGKPDLLEAAAEKAKLSGSI